LFWYFCVLSFFIIGGICGDDLLITLHSGSDMVLFSTSSKSAETVKLTGTSSHPELRGMAFLANGSMLISDARREQTHLYVTNTTVLHSRSSVAATLFGPDNKGQIHTYGVVVTPTNVYESNQDGADTITYHTLDGKAMGSFWKSPVADKAKVRGLTFFPKLGSNGSLLACLKGSDEIAVLDIATQAKVQSIPIKSPNSIQIHPVTGVMFTSSDSSSVSLQRRAHLKATRRSMQHSTPDSIQIFEPHANFTAWTQTASLADPVHYTHPCGMTISLESETLYVLYQNPPAVVAWNISGPCCAYAQINVFNLNSSYSPEQLTIIFKVTSRSWFR